MEKLKPIYGTFVFEMYNKTLNLQQKMIKLGTDGDVVSNEDLVRQLSDIDRVYHFISKMSVMNDVNNGRVIPVFSNDPAMNVPSTIPSFLINRNGKACAVVNLSNHATKNRDGIYNIDTKVLFSLLQSGTISARCFEKCSKLKVDTAFIRSATIVYSKLFTKTLNKMFSLNTVPDKLDITHFLTGLFFLVNVLGLKFDNPIVHKNAMAACKVPSAVPVAFILAKFKHTDFDNLDTFITALSKNVSVFQTLKTRNFLDNYIQMYSPTMILSLEYLPIFLHNIFSAIVGSYMNNQFAIEQTCGKEMDNLYKAFFSV